MKCTETRKWMSPYLDSELGKTKTFEVSEHLARCPDCARRFESERRVDELMRSRMESGPMPDEVWSRITRGLATPWWVRRLRTVRGLAVAACFVIAAVAVGVFYPSDDGTDGPWIVDRFEAITADGLPFPGEANAPTDVARVIRETLGVGLAMAPPARVMDAHRIEMVSVTTRRDENGREYVEVRLNCCGEPVLLTLASPDDAIQRVRFESAVFGEDDTARSASGVNFARMRFGGVLAMVASRHSVAPIMSSLAFTGM